MVERSATWNVPASVPSLLQRPQPGVEYGGHAKKRRLPTSTREVDVEPAENVPVDPGVTSFYSFVPAAVPSLVQGSYPWMPSSKMK